jgi:hypothetical protein
MSSLALTRIEPWLASRYRSGRAPNILLPVGTRRRAGRSEPARAAVEVGCVHVEKLTAPGVAVSEVAVPPHVGAVRHHGALRPRSSVH